MPARHKPSFLSTADLNRAGERMRSRHSEGPKSTFFMGAIIRALLTRWKLSRRTEDKHLIDLIEKLVIYEDRIVSNGGHLLTELDKPNQGVFGPIFAALASPTPPQKMRKLPKHDALIVSVQYDFLWALERHHPFPRTSAKSQQVWLATHWKRIDRVSRDFLCHCIYKIPDTEPPTLAFPTSPKELFLDILAHLHNSKFDSINHLLKPAARSKP